MEPVRDWEAYGRLAATVRRAGPSYTSNLYAACEMVERWGPAGRLSALVTDGAVLLLRADRDFARVYHLAENGDALARALARLPGGRYVADLIGRDEALDAVTRSYAASGFTSHATLRRMTRVQPTGEPEEGGATVATPADAPEVAAFLERLLDPLAEQLPEVEELREQADAGHLLLARRDGALAGMLAYDVGGALGHLRFWHVDATARGQGVGRDLMQAFLARCAQARRLVLWVMGDNQRSIDIYRHYGFTLDGLLDAVMISHKDQRA